MSRSLSLPFALAVSALMAFSPGAFAQAPDRPQPTCVTNVQIGRGEDAPLGTLLLRDGRIEAVLPADAEPPPGMRVVDGEGLLCLPAFVDAYSRTGVDTPKPVVERDKPVDVSSDVRVDMRLANRKGIQPAFRAAEALAIDPKDSKAWREAGFGAVLVAPGGQLLAGTSALTTTRDAAMRDVAVKADVFAHGAFEASEPSAEEEGGRRRGGAYPTTLMGFIAQLRQFFLDAAWQAERTKRYEQGRPGLRPPFDADLAAGVELLSGDQKLVCDVSTYRDVERWIKLGDELGFQVAFTGGADAWRVADVLAARDIPIVLTLDWGKEVDDPLDKKKKKGKKDKGEKEEGESEPAEEQDPEAEEIEEADLDPEAVEEIEEVASETAGEEDVEEAEDEIAWEYEEPLGVRIEKRREWEEDRDCAIVLAEAGVQFAFGTDGAKPKKLLENVRELVEAGLAADAALAALTVEPAAILGVGNRLGQIAPGYDATLTLWTKDPLTEKKAKPAWIFVDGFPTEFELPEEKEDAEGESGDGPAEGLDVSGTWVVEVEREDGSSELTFVLTMAEDGSVEGELTTTNPMDQSEMTAEVTGSLSGDVLTLDYTIRIQEFEINSTVSGRVEGDAWSGDSSTEIPWSEEPIENTFQGKREPDQQTQPRR